MSSTCHITSLFTSALTLVSLQFVVPSLNLAFPASAQAESSVKYQPPNRNAPKRTDGTGVRSSSGFRCPTSPNALFIAALAPTTHTGETLAARPTLYTYFSGTEQIDVQLREIGTLIPLWKQTLQASTPGFAAIAYPSDAPELITGKEYQWSVEVVCDSTKRYLNKGYTSAKLKRVAEPSALKDSLAKASSPIDRAQVYAAQSLWYEALDSLASASLASPTDLALRTQLIELLEQGGLTKAAKQARAANPPSSSVPPQPERDYRTPPKLPRCQRIATEIKLDRTRCL